jgi:hypothetical protein
VQLIATAHGNTLENLMLNPTLSDLVGGVQTVILGDVEARRRRTQKTVLERKGPPTFPILVEIQSWDRVAIHPNVAETIDAMLRGVPPSPEVRSVDSIGRIRKTRPTVLAPPVPDAALASSNLPGPGRLEEDAPPPRSTRVLPFGVSRSKLEQLVRGNRASVAVVRDLSEADVLLTTKNYYRRRSTTLQMAETEGKPIYVLRKNTVPQMEQFLRNVSPGGDGADRDPVREALREADSGVERVRSGEQEVELNPHSGYVRRLQHLIAQRSQVASRSRGREPHRRVTLFRE